MLLLLCGVTNAIEFVSIDRWCLRPKSKNEKPVEMCIDGVNLYLILIKKIETKNESVLQSKRMVCFVVCTMS